MLKEIAILLPIFTTLFWCLVFLIQLGKHNKAKFQLGIFMAVACLLYITHAIFFSKIYWLYAYLESLYILTYLSVYPLYFKYLKYISFHKISTKHRLIHLSPAITLAVLSFILTLFLNESQRLNYVKEILVDKNLKELQIATLAGIKGVIFLLSRIVFIIQAVYYTLRGIFVARIHNQAILNHYSNTEGKSMNWVLILHYSLLIVAASSITAAFIGRSYFMQNENTLIIPSLVFSIFYFTIGINGNRQVNLTEEAIELKSFLEPVEGNNGTLKQKLDEIFTNQQIYKKPDLRLTTVAANLHTNRTYLSNLINEEYNMNFNEFVNKFRIDYAKSLLQKKEHENFSLDYIAENSGFGSVSSFTRVFKSFEGITPGKYRSSL